MKIKSKLPNVGTTIFTIMSALANEHNAINLSQGFPNFDTPQALLDLVHHYLQDHKNQYEPMAGAPILREVLSEKLTFSYQLAINPTTEITICAGATQAIFTAIAAFVKKGDEVIILEPAYDSYRPSIEVQGAKAVPYTLESPHFKIDWEAFGLLITRKTKMIIINTPHNPTGKTLKNEDLLALERLTEGTTILVLSDEVYEHLIYDGQLHQSVLRYPKLFQRSLAVYSFGKTFHSTGWKIGYCVAPEKLMTEFRKVHQFNVFSVNSFVQYALADFLKNRAFYLDLPYFYQNKRDLLNQCLEGSALQPIDSEGTYFQLYDYSAISKEKDIDFVRKLTIEKGVASIPLSVFYSTPRHDKIIRLCFAKTSDLLEKAAGILSRI